MVRPTLTFRVPPTHGYQDLAPHQCHQPQVPAPKSCRLTYPPFLSQIPKAHSCTITPNLPTLPGPALTSKLNPGSHLPFTAFPDQLVVSPETLAPGQDREVEVTCTAHNISGPDRLSFALLLGNQTLEGVRAQEPEQEEETQEAEGMPLFRMTQRWLLPSLETPPPPALYCQVTMQLFNLTLTHKMELPGKPSGFHLSLGSAALALGPGLLVPTRRFPGPSARAQCLPREATREKTNSKDKGLLCASSKMISAPFSVPKWLALPCSDCPERLGWGQRSVGAL